MADLYIGVMSGTSLDGVDAVLVELGESDCTVLAAKTSPYPRQLDSDLRSLVRKPQASLVDIGTLDVAIGEFFAECVLDLVSDSPFDPSRIVAIGISGHTAYHKPDAPRAFTLQLGDPNTVAARTAMTTVADMRGTDVAFGGQGAPMVPPFHSWRFSDVREVRVVVNIGGIANLTCLNAERPLRGFDSGPGNTLMDIWCERNRGERFDRDGEWAASGTVNPALLTRMSADAYFKKVSPKSTGLEHFNLAWLEHALSATGRKLDPADVQATLLELTATTIAASLNTSEPEAGRAILCGGGAYNTALVRRLRALLPGLQVESSAAHGIPPEWVEAAAFAWLARLRLIGKAGNAPSVTGARQAVVLGGVYSGNQPTR
jgi:anhydro-N-acetylmuramic acid kinase